MKKIIIISLSLFILLFCGSCDDFELFPEKGNALFYTNVQSTLTCGSFDVDVFINSRHFCTLSEPYAASPSEDAPDCQTTSYSKLKRMKIGTYSYKASYDCGSIGEIAGTFNVATDSCSLVFINIANATYEN